MNRIAILDPLNLKDYIGMVNEYVKANCPASDLRNTLRFLQVSLEGIQTELKDPINDLQKIMSGALPPARVEPVRKTLYEQETVLLENFQRISAELDQSSNAAYFYQQLQDCIYEPYFDPEEVGRLKAPMEHSTFLMQLFHHAMDHLDRLPCYSANRLVEEAKTIDYDQPLRFFLFKAAADLGSKEASLEYGNYCNRTRSDGKVPERDAREAFRYTMAALPMPAAYWNLAYQLECQQLTEQEVKELSQTIKIENKVKTLAERQELEWVQCTHPDPQTRRNLWLAYRICFYLGFTGFYKGFNSLSKFLTQQRYSFAAAEGTACSRQELADRYAKLALCNGGNLLTMQGVGLDMLRIEREKETPDVRRLEYAERLLTTAATHGLKRSALELGKRYAKEQNEQKRACAVQIMHYLLDSNYQGEAWFHLGLLTDDPEKRLSYFKNALKHGFADASYPLAMEAYRQFREDHNVLHIHDGLSVLEQYLPRMRQNSERARSLQKALQQLIEN